MDHVFILEAAHHVDNGVALADVCQELVAQAFALGGTLDKAGDVNEFDDRRGNFLRVVQIAQLLQALVRHRHNTHVGVDGAEGVVRRLGARLRERIE